MRRSTILVWCVALAAAGVQAFSADTLRVNVRDSADGSGVRAVVIAVGKPGTLVTARTDAAGTAVLELPDREHVSIVVRSDTHGFRCFGPEAVSALAVDAAMEPTVRVQGVVIGGDGRPVPNATVKLQYRGMDRCRVRFDTLAEEQMTREGGEFTLRHIDVSQDFDVLVTHPEHSPQVVGKIELLSAPLVDGTRRVDLRLRK